MRQSDQPTKSKVMMHKVPIHARLNRNPRSGTTDDQKAARRAARIAQESTLMMAAVHPREGSAYSRKCEERECLDQMVSAPRTDMSVRLEGTFGVTVERSGTQEEGGLWHQLQRAEVYTG